MIKPVAKEAKMNKAEAAQPKSGHDRPAGKAAGKSNDVGAERHANMAGAFSGAVAELHAQHPHAHDDHGPHHDDTSHLRHKPYRMS